MLPWSRILFSAVFMMGPVAVYQIFDLGSLPEASGPFDKAVNGMAGFMINTLPILWLIWAAKNGWSFYNERADIPSSSYSGFGKGPRQDKEVIVVTLPPPSMVESVPAYLPTGVGSFRGSRYSTRTIPCLGETVTVPTIPWGNRDVS